MQRNKNKDAIYPIALKQRLLEVFFCVKCRISILGRIQSFREGGSRYGPPKTVPCFFDIVVSENVVLRAVKLIKRVSCILIVTDRSDIT